MSEKKEKREEAHAVKRALELFFFDDDLRIILKDMWYICFLGYLDEKRKLRNESHKQLCVFPI